MSLLFILGFALKRGIDSAKERHLLYNLYLTKAYLEDFGKNAGGYPATLDLSPSFFEKNLRESLSLKEFVNQLRNPLRKSRVSIYLCDDSLKASPGDIIYCPRGERVKYSLYNDFELSVSNRSGKLVRPFLTGDIKKITYTRNPLTKPDAKSE